jgi:hypothetical protein
MTHIAPEELELMLQEQEDYAKRVQDPDFIKKAISILMDDKSNSKEILTCLSDLYSVQVYDEEERESIRKGLFKRAIEWRDKRPFEQSNAAAFVRVFGCMIEFEEIEKLFNFCRPEDSLDVRFSSMHVLQDILISSRKKEESFLPLIWDMQSKNENLYFLGKKPTAKQIVNNPGSNSAIPMLLDWYFLAVAALSNNPNLSLYEERFMKSNDLLPEFLFKRIEEALPNLEKQEISKERMETIKRFIERCKNYKIERKKKYA